MHCDASVQQETYERQPRRAKPLARLHFNAMGFHETMKGSKVIQMFIQCYKHMLSLNIVNLCKLVLQVSRFMSLTEENLSQLRLQVGI